MAENPNSSLPKWPFLIGDLILVILACFIVIASPKPMTAITIFACALSVLLGMIIFVTPYLIEHFTLQQNLKLKQAKSGETLLKATELSEVLLKRTENLHAEVMKAVLAAKQIPALLEEKSDRLHHALNADNLTSAISDIEDLLQKFEALDLPDVSQTGDAGKEIGKQVKDLRKDLEAQWTAWPEDLKNALAEFTKEISEKFDKQPKQAEIWTTAEPEPEKREPIPGSSKTRVSKENSSLPAGTGNIPPEPETQEMDIRSETEAGEEIEENSPESDAYVQEEETEFEMEETMDSEALDSPANTRNEDGATRLIVGAFIGISNKLYIRGEGPGLSWDKGVPMELVGIGKWEWKTYEASNTVRCRVLINDEQWTDSDDIEIEPNTTTETTASF